MTTSQPQPPNGDRLDRIERALEHLVSVQGSHETRLGRLEAGMQGLVDLLGTLAQQADRRFLETDQRFRDTDDKLNALIRIVDDWIRHQPPPEQRG